MARPRLPVPSRLVNVKFHLRPGEDDDLIRFFADLPPRQRAAAVKVALRAGGMTQVTLADLSDDEALVAALLEGGMVF